jgi:hypothetical protein
MFDLRYHVASLTAVFVALVIGILVGVAISSHTNFDRKLLEEQKAEVQRRLDEQTARAVQLAEGQRAAIALSQSAYPLVMADRLRGKRIGIVFVGPLDPRSRSSPIRPSRRRSATSSGSSSSRPARRRSGPRSPAS